MQIHFTTTGGQEVRLSVLQAQAMVALLQRGPLTHVQLNLNNEAILDHLETFGLTRRIEKGYWQLTDAGAAWTRSMQASIPPAKAARVRILA